MTARRRPDILAPRLVWMTAAGPLPGMSLRSGTVGRATSGSSITWCDPERAVVEVSLTWLDLDLSSSPIEHIALLM